MRYRREGYPGEDEFVLSTVTKILNHAVFVNLDEYDKGGLIHISEIAPGRIRNIRDYVEVGKKIVCKTLRVEPEKGHIDLSLRRVTDMERKKKLGQIKQEQKAEKIIEMAAHELKQSADALYDAITEKVFEKYQFVHLFFKDVAEGAVPIDKAGLAQDVADTLSAIVAERFKPAHIAIKGVFNMKSYAPDGVAVVKNALLGAEKAAHKGATVTVAYLGGGRYETRVVAENYKDAEKTLAAVEAHVREIMEEGEGEVTFARAG